MLRNLGRVTWRGAQRLSCVDVDTGERIQHPRLLREVVRGGACEGTRRGLARRSVVHHEAAHTVDVDGGQAYEPQVGDAREHAADRGRIVRRFGRFGQLGQQEHRQRLLGHWDHPERGAARMLCELFCELVYRGAARVERMLSRELSLGSKNLGRAKT